MNNIKICAVVVTFNRKELLLRNITRILGQSVDVDVLIFDNNSVDGTEEYLCEHGILDKHQVIYYRSGENLGGAGGFAQGMQKVYELGYDLIWLMDDDGYCCNGNTLEELLSKIPRELNEAFIYNSTVICNDDRDLTFGFPGISTYKQLAEASNRGVYDGYINPFNGTLVSRACIDKIGFPRGEFFIYGDEHEYMLRALKNNVKVRTILDSLYYHPVNRKISYRKVWKFEVPIKTEPVWKTFCDTRNGVFISREYDSRKTLIIRIMVALLSAFFREEKWKYMKYTLLAIYDGLTANFARPIMFDK